MALEGTYEYECMRAELLGIDKPDYEEFVKNKAEKEAVEKAELEAEANKEFVVEKEHFEQTGRKLDELGNILKSTQKKINNITAPFSTYLKSKISRRGSASSSREDSLQNDRMELESNQEDPPETEDKQCSGSADLSDGKAKDVMLDHTPLIDNLIEKTEKHTLGMEYQIKKMKKFK